MKKSQKILLSLLSITAAGSLATGVAIGVKNNNEFANALIKTNSVKQDNTTNALIPSEKNDQNANLSTASGPLTFWGNTITALDWFGSKLWSIDMAQYNKDSTDKLNGSQYTGQWSRAWFNWDYNRASNTLWVLGYYGGTNKNQLLFKINAANGTILKTISLGDTNGRRFISALVSGNVMIYGSAADDFKDKIQAYLYNDTTGSVSPINGDSNKQAPTSDGTKSNYRWYFFNLIPVSNNRNFVEIVSFSKTSGTTGDGGEKDASYDVYFILVDDNLNFVGNSYNDWRNGAVKVASGMAGFRNSTITPQRDYYTMLNGDVVTVVYNTVILINTNSISVSKFAMSESKWILSWSLDSNENLFFKFKDDGKIYEVTSDAMKSAGISGYATPVTYLDLSSVNTDIGNNKKVSSYANSYVIFNVFGYSGALMLVNENYNARVENKTKPANSDTDQYGLAIGVTQNTSDTTKGDYYGLLNTDKSVISSADFNIDNTVLASKIPSEITRNDVKTLNDSFFQDGTGYKPFEIKNIDDSKGTFTIVANLYKIPWYAKTLPTNAIPKEIEKSFTTTNKITNKVSWINLNTTTNYDFLNSLPSAITQQDVNTLNPFVATFQSQVITDAKTGAQLYPKTTYSIGNKNDTTGEINISATYSYVPMGVEYTGATGQVKTYTATHKYTVFNNKQTAEFDFMGGTKNSETQTISVSNVDQLKTFIQSGNLPSSIADALNNGSKDNSQYLQFINTDLSKGYPISKMNFSAAGNDNAGTLTIKASIAANNATDKKDHTFTITYNNLNVLNTYSFSFTNATQINSVSFAQSLASSITSGEVLSNLITYKGFDSNNFNITLVPDDIKGDLTVNVSLDKSYAKSIGNSGHGFNNYVASKTFSGFLTTADYNTQYSVAFKSDDDISLLDLKQIQPVQIYNALGDGTSNPTNQSGLKVGNTTYKNLNDLAEKLLVKTLGKAVPSNWENNANIKTYMYYDNNLGYVSFLVNIDKSLMNGASSDLNLIVNYTGFVKGNIVNTQDNMSFISNAMLKNYLISKGIFSEVQYSQLTPDAFANWANQKENLKKLITFQSGEYATKLTSNDFSVVAVANDAQNTVSITVDYGTLKDQNSLSEYSIQYTI